MRGGGRTWSGDDRGRSASSRPATCSTGCCRRSRAARRADPGMLDVPVLLIVYRRPDLAARVLDVIDESYYFSKYSLTWGWATWRRAWRLYDRQFATWPALRNRPETAALFDTPDERRYWTTTFDQQHEGPLTDWDYAWWYTCMTHGLSIHPAVNLVTNAGSGTDATHTAGAAVCHRAVGTLGTPYRHPARVVRNRAADLDTFDHRLVGALLKHQRTWRHHAGRPARWLRRLLGRAPAP